MAITGWWTLPSLLTEGSHPVAHRKGGGCSSSSYTVGLRSWWRRQPPGFDHRQRASSDVGFETAAIVADQSSFSGTRRCARNKAPKREKHSQFAIDVSIPALVDVSGHIDGEARLLAFTKGRVVTSSRSRSLRSRLIYRIASVSSLSTMTGLSEVFSFSLLSTRQVEFTGTGTLKSFIVYHCEPITGQEKYFSEYDILPVTLQHLPFLNE